MKPLRGAILECDRVAEPLASRHGQYADMIERMFAAVTDRVRFDRFDCRQGDYPVDLDPYDFFITTGSKASAYDDDPWIAALIAFVQRLESERRCLIGICFGHQIIAIARRGRVERSAKGWGIGIAGNRLVAHPAWLAPAAGGALKLIVSHQDQVSELAAGAQLIAGSDFCPYFMVQWDDCTLSVQGHPEWDRDYSRALIEQRRAQFTAEQVDAALRSLDEAPDNDVFTRWALEFIERCRQAE